MDSRKRLITGIMLLVLFSGLAAYGVMRGEMPVVFTKAVHLCLECIGIG